MSGWDHNIDERASFWRSEHDFSRLMQESLILNDRKRPRTPKNVNLQTLCH